MELLDEEFMRHLNRQPRNGLYKILKVAETHRKMPEMMNNLFFVEQSTMALVAVDAINARKDVYDKLTIAEKRDVKYVDNIIRKIIISLDKRG